MGTVVPFNRKASLAERVAREYGWQVRRLMATDGHEARNACLGLGRAFVFRCFDPHGRYPETDFCIDAKNAWECACIHLWGDRFVARHGQAMYDRYVRNDGGLSGGEPEAA